MRAEVRIPKLQGIIQVPPSKSFMQRVCALALLNNGTTIIRNPGSSKDDLAALHIIRTLGAKITRISSRMLTIESHGMTDFKGLLHAGESGLSARLFIPIAALSQQPVQINGEGTLLHRSMQWITEVLPQLDVQVECDEGILPIQVKGPLKAKDLEVDGSQSSQYISGLIMAMAHATHKPVELRLTNLVSKPYLLLTIELMKRFGYVIHFNNEDRVLIQPQPARSNQQQVDVDIEGDWSASAALLVAAAIGGEVNLTGLSYPSVQGDAAIIDVLQQAGAHVDITPEKIRVVHVGQLAPFHYHATDTPDLFPVLAIMAMCTSGVSTIHGVERLMNKESNRAESVSALVKALGGRVEINGDAMRIEGPLRGTEAPVYSFQDHRLVMASAIAAVALDSPVIIEEAQAVEKSYPEFFNDLKKLGAQVYLT